MDWFRAWQGTTSSPPPVRVPAAITAFGVNTDTPLQAGFLWAAPTDPGNPPTVNLYRLTISGQAPVLVVPTVVNGTGGTVAALAAGNYTYTVEASNNQGVSWSAPTPSTGFTVNDTPPPPPPDPLDPPATVTATAGELSAVVSWTADTPAETATHRVTPSTGEDPQYTGAAATTLTFFGLTDGIPVTFTVARGDSDGVYGPESTASNQVVPFATPPPPLRAPGPITGYGVNVSTPLHAVFLWVVPSDFGNPATVNAYRLQISGQAPTVIVPDPVNTGSFSDVTLAAGTYTYTLEASNDNGTTWGNATPTTAFTVVDEPQTTPLAPPASVTATALAEGAHVVWSADAPTGTVAQRVTPSLGAVVPQVVGPTVTSLDFFGLPVGIPVTFTVARGDSLGVYGDESGPSNEVTPLSSTEPPPFLGFLPAPGEGVLTILENS
jgi:hypothetical protein